MQLALVNNKRVEAFEGGRGNCPICGAVTIAKCGPKIINHWAHFRLRDCDPWWENETQWHRDWKNNFPLECREVSHVALDGEIHRADVETPTGIIVELQHSPMSDKERISREEFYKNLVWVIDGEEFKQNFKFCHILPDPHSALGKDLVWYKAKHDDLIPVNENGMFYRISETNKTYPEVSEINKNNLEAIPGLVQVHSLREIYKEVQDNHKGHYQFEWKRPRTTWLEAKCPVYIDLGGPFLAKLETYDETGLKCIRYISKSKFMYDVMHEEKVENIAKKWFNIKEWVDAQNFNFDKYG